MQVRRRDCQAQICAGQSVETRVCEQFPCLRIQNSELFEYQLYAAKITYNWNFLQRNGRCGKNGLSAPYRAQVVRACDDVAAPAAGFASVRASSSTPATVLLVPTVPSSSPTLLLGYLGRAGAGTSTGGRYSKYILIFKSHTYFQLYEKL